MDIVKFPLGADASGALSISGGDVQLLVKVSAKPEIDALLGKLKAGLPDALKPLADAAQAAIDSALSQP